MLSNVQLWKKQVKKNTTLLKPRYTSARIKTNTTTTTTNFALRIRRLHISNNNNSENSKNLDQLLLNTMHMSLYLVNGSSASFGDSSSSAAANNPQLTNFGVSSASASSSTAATVSSQEEHDEGQLLGEPVAGAASVEERSSMSKPTQTISHGVISVVGRQRSLEDAVAVAPGLVRVMSNKQHGDSKGVMMEYDFFAVYDGHGDHGVGHRCKERLHHFVAEEVDYYAGVVDQWKSVMTRSFTKMSYEIASKEQELYAVNPLEESVGSMALVVLVSVEQIVVANCGRSRAVLFRDGVAVPLSCNQHQSQRPEEKERLEGGRANVGGIHQFTPASIGTCSVRDQIIAAPDVTVHKRTSSDDFLVIATDGLWDVVSNDMACDIIRKRCTGEVINKMVLADGLINNDAAACAAMLVELALARGSKDNISVIVVELKRFRGTIGSSSAST